jgi:ribonucleoside-diphosphate reductase beta chain|tara:strand:- start:328 stop:1422 length:1095 start_codon:yes stop_codon:yes gene_type:complete
MFKSFDVNTNDSITKNMFFDEPVAIARYDIQKYRTLESFTESQLGFFWMPEEIDVSKDAKDFKALSNHEQHIFTSNLKRQIVLDSVQGRCPSAVFGPLASLPELENWITTWVFSEQIHSRSYTHIIRNIYSNPSEVFDGITDIKEITDCAESISRHYDNLARHNEQAAVDSSLFGTYEHKKLLWLALQATNSLEGLRFYVSFACSWAFAETKKSMEGNAKIIKLICRDENLHLASTVFMIKSLPREDEDFAKIRDECHDQCVEIYEQTAEQEKEWAKYLFKDGSMVGLNESMLCAYIEWLAHRRMKSVGLTTKYPGGSDPLPWTKKWIAGGNVQVAPQETEISSYTTGGISKDVNEEEFTGFQL